MADTPFPLVAWLSPDDPLPDECLRHPTDCVAHYYQTLSKRLHRVISRSFRLLRNEDVEEIVMDTFDAFRSTLVAGERIERPRPWLFTVARHRALNKTKQVMRETERFPTLADRSWEPRDPAETPEESAIADQRQRALRQALVTLPLIQQQCVVMRAEGLTLREIGAVVNLDKRRVGELVEKAKNTLERMLRA